MTVSTAQWFCFRVSEDVARRLTGRSPEGILPLLRSALDGAYLKIEPLRPGVSHPAFARWFRARLDSYEDGPALLQRLLDSGSIEYGYLKTDRLLLLRGWTV